MNTNTSKVLVALLVVFVTLMVSSVVYHLVNKEFVTETAILATAEDSITFKGVYVRDEKPVLYNGSGAVSYSVLDGGKLGKGTTIAEIYASDTEIETRQKIENLNHELSILKKIENPGTSDVEKPASLSNLILEKYKSTVYDLEMNDINSLAKNKEELLILISTMQMVTGNSDEYRLNIQQNINEIQAEIDSLKASQSSPIDRIISNESSYFVSYVDGYEDEITKANIDNLTVDYINSVNDNVSENTEGVLGKTIEGYKWYIVGVIDNSNNKYSETESLYLKLESTPQQVRAVVERIKPTDNANESIVILSCDKLTYDLVQHRTERVEMIKGVYEGVKVPRDAMRFKDIEETVTDEITGEKVKKTTNYRGVYVKLGEQVLFKKLDVIFEGDKYVISNINKGSEYVVLYDDIIVEGIDANGN
ncbi:MAG TPA: hypothetical protein GX710_05435 [Clostridiales bacterium]|nr:hypothetical protein [Clostridiales bacterium]